MVVTNDGLGIPHIAAYGQGIRSIWCKGSFLKLCISTQCKEAKRQRKLVISMVSVICPLCFRVTGGVFETPLQLYIFSWSKRF